MKRFTRGLGLVLVLAGMLGLTGCTADNESEAARAKPLGTPENVKSDPGATKQAAPTSQEQWKKQQGDAYKTKGYPGAERSKSG